ncbi:hypothetical protein [Natrinema salsiterrestre]|nr:hypothetical protein [Natrinema salsiterrestre]
MDTILLLIGAGLILVMAYRRLRKTQRKLKEHFRSGIYEVKEN